MSKVIKFLLIVLLFIGFFEAGLISSYTIVTSKVPDIKGLVDLQIDTVTSFFSSDNINELIVKDPDPVTVSNKIEVADKLKSLAKVDGVNIQNLNATTFQNSNSESFEITIIAFGYGEPNGTTGQIILSNEPQYKITATANAKYTYSGAEVDVTSIKVISVLSIYN
ncbi:MAG: hypothetical protein FWH54_02560 [Methanobrevibacter sp.]|nr:hypothetical protein [Methanobrevibacter sp.]